MRLADVSQFLRNANSFVASSRAAIEWSAPHIYLSALPFAPKDSLVYLEFSSLLRGVVSVETFGIDHHGGRLVMNLTGHESYALTIAYSPDGRLLASGSGDGAVRIWNTLTGEEAVAPLQIDDGAVFSVAFSPDGLRILSGTDRGAVHIWDIQMGRSVMSPLRGHSHRVCSVAFSPDGRLIASGSADKSVRLWDAQTGQIIVVLTDHTDWVRSVVFSPVGHTLASGSDDCTVRRWNVRTGEPQGQPLRGADGAVFPVAFSPDGQFIAAEFYSAQEIRIWNVSTSEELAAPFKTGCRVDDLVFAPDGSRLVSTNPDGIRF